MKTTYKVRLANDSLVFSSAHFITFANGECETLHGHDFRVTLELEAALDPDGQYVLDFLQLEKTLKSLLRHLDHKILLQSENPYLQLRVQEAEPVDEPDAIQQWVSSVGNWLSRRDFSQDTGDMLAQERELEIRLSRELGLPPVTPETQSNTQDVLHAEVEVRFQHRRWLFPEEDCVILPIENTTAEKLAEYLAKELLKQPILAENPIQRLSVQIEESVGMTGICEIQP